MKKLIVVTVAFCAALTLVWVQDAYSHNPVMTTVLFNREIATVFNARCLQCHNDEGMAMPLQTHAQARPWAIAIKEEVLARRMPPWPAERGYGAFANDGGLTPRELEFLISWIDGGVPQGDGAPPDYQDHSGHWMLGAPDGEHAGTLDAAGSRPGITRFIVDPGLREDGWLRAVDMKMPDKRAARSAFFSLAGTGEFLGGWTPWHTSTEFPEGVAYRLPAGARIAVEVHHAASTSITEPPRLGLYLMRGAPQALGAMVVGAEAPAGEARARAAAAVPSARTVVALRVDLSAGGRSIEINARRPDGVFEPLLWIKNYRHDWQVPFLLKVPVTLPAGSVIQATTYFDSSAPSPRRATVHVAAYEPTAAAGDAAAPAAPAHIH